MNVFIPKQVYQASSPEEKVHLHHWCRVHSGGLEWNPDDREAGCTCACLQNLQPCTASVGPKVIECRWYWKQCQDQFFYALWYSKIKVTYTLEWNLRHCTGGSWFWHESNSESQPLQWTSDFLASDGTLSERGRRQQKQTKEKKQEMFLLMIYDNSRSVLTGVKHKRQFPEAAVLL